MESPRNHGGSEEEEEYSSCESGWTMYIGDTFHGNDHSSVVVDEDDDNDYESHVKDVDDDYENDGGDEVSDDSMASDASSGPSNRLPNKIIKHATKQVYIQKRQNTEKTLSNEGEKSELKARTRTSAASRVQSRGKVSKTK
ncbi:hypothetical protein Bca4012_056118 [Brassica carinata]|uniref:Uncharacterized protein n=1 Tax=Brassica carinata TaxID=52824 RepID=A0A8X8B325_BRACI|nr:hypothetical protein Bca52824_014058 [Brassica carinata]